jgi:predicted DNA-binding WGR domain protein
MDNDLQFQGGASDKFYKMQMLVSNDGKTFWLVQHWGKNGTKGACKITDFTD